MKTTRPPLTGTKPLNDTPYDTATGSPVSATTAATRTDAGKQPAVLHIAPRVIRCKDAPAYLGMDRNRFNAEVRFEDCRDLPGHKSARILTTTRHRKPATS